MMAAPPKWMLWAVVIFLLLLGLATASISFVLPTYVENRVIPGLAHDLGLTPGQIRVRRIGWWGADLGPTGFTSNQAPAVSLASLQIDYSPLSLIRGRINGITLAGLDITVLATSKGVSIAGIKPPPKTDPTQADKTAPDLRTLLPIKLERISVLKSQLIVATHDRRIVIPFDIDLKTDRLDTGQLDGQARFSIAGHPLVLEAAVDQAANNAQVSFEIDELLLESLSRIGLKPTQTKTSGKIDIHGRATFGLQPLGITGLSAKGQIRNVHIGVANGRLENKVTSQGVSIPINLSIEAEGPDSFQWQMAPFSISGLISAAVNECSGRLAYADRQWSLDTVINTLVPRQALPEGGMLESEIPIQWRISARGKDSDKVEFDLQGKSDKPLKAAVKDLKLSSRKHEIDISGHLQKGALHAQSKFTTGEISAQMAGGRLNAPLFTVDTTLTIPDTGSPAPISISAHGTVTKVRSKFDTTSMLLPELTVAATASGGGGSDATWRCDARVDMARGRVSDSAYEVEMAPFSISMPFKWPDPSDTETGRIRVSDIRWKDRRLGGLSGTVRQVPEGWTVNLHHPSKLFPGLRVLIDGRLDRSGARIMAEIPSHRMAEEIDLGRFIPKAAGFRLAGQLAARSELTADEGGIRSSGQIAFTKGRLREEGKDLLLEGIDIKIQMDDLLKAKSAPRQRLRIDALTFGNLKADHLDVDFQIENPKTLFIERSGINWSRGKVNTSSIRVVSDLDDYDVTLFCDRLNLAMVLEQLGAAQARGEGTVSGRVPIRWTKGRLKFDNGFLYSTPGQSGSIQITDTQKLLAGLPPGSPQHTQLDIATEALKDYTYKWTKLNVLSEKEILLLKLQFDGKPNRLLPFAYDQSMGQFKRVEGEGQADFKGISIDLNFRSPLNDIINYKDLLKQPN